MDNSKGGSDRGQKVGMARVWGILGVKWRKLLEQFKKQKKTSVGKREECFFNIKALEETIKK